MTIYVMRYYEYLREMDISDFSEEKEATAFVNQWPEGEGQTAIIIHGPAQLRMSPQWRRDVYNLLLAEDEPELPETEDVGCERLFIRIESWMKET